MSKTKTRHASKRGAAPQRPGKDDSTPKVMGFGAFRKHQKLMLWVAVGFTVLVFGAFASMGDIQSMIEGGQTGGIMAEFVVPATGERVQVERDEYSRARNALARMSYGQRDFTEDDVWTHLLLVADAEAAGLRISDEDLRRSLGPGLAGVTKSQYLAFVRQRGFTSVHDFEQVLRQDLLKSRYLDVVSRDGAVVDAETVYRRWRVDNELFSYEALVFTDEDVEDIEAPDESELRAFWDDIPEKSRSRQYRDPARQDLVLGSLMLDHDLSTLPEEKTAELAEPTDPELRSRFNLTKADRFPEAEELTDEIRAVLAGEIKIIRYMQNAFRQFSEAEEGAETKANFVALVGEFGLLLIDPEGLLGPDEQEHRPGFGNANLARLSRVAGKGIIRLNTPYGDQNQVQLVFYEDHVDAEGRDFDGARDQLQEDWREAQRDRRAVAFREALVEYARSIPEAVEEIAPLEALAAEEAERRLAETGAATGAAAGDEVSAEVLDAAAVAAEELAKMQPAIDAVVARFESRAWDELAADSGAERYVFERVSRSYVFAPDEGEDSSSIERYLKTNSNVFARSADTLTPALRHGLSYSTAIVRVTAREMPELAAMFDDPPGMARARNVVMGERRRSALLDTADPEALKASHQLRMVEEAPADN